MGIKQNKARSSIFLHNCTKKYTNHVDGNKKQAKGDQKIAFYNL